MDSIAFLALFNMPGGTEWIVIAVIALLLFGRRLPDVARSFGRSIVEFKKGIRDVRDDINHDAPAASPSRRPLQPSEPAEAVPRPAGGAEPTAEKHDVP